MPFSRFLLAGSMLLGACSSSPDKHAPPYEVADSSGIEIVESNLPLRENGGGWAASEHPTLTISIHPTNPDQVIHWVRGAVRLSDGRIAVISESARTLMFFDSSGEWIESVGRDGSGPGEFRTPYQLIRLSGDTLVVSERGSRRVSWFSPSGEYLRMATPDRNNLSDLIPDTLQTRAGRFFAPGLIVWEVGNLRDFRVGERFRNLFGFLVTDANGGSPALLGWFPEWERFGVSREISRWAFFGNRTYSAVGEDPQRIYIGDSREFSIQAFSANGQLVQIIRDAIPPTHISDEDIRWERWEVLDWAQSMGMYEQWLRFADAMPIPEEKPAFEHLIVDSQGYLWAKEYSSYRPDPIRYRIFSPEGRRVGSVRLPGRFRVLDIGLNYVLGLYLDSDYLETVQMYHLERPGR